MEKFAKFKGCSDCRGTRDISKLASLALPSFFLKMNEIKKIKINKLIRRKKFHLSLTYDYLMFLNIKFDGQFLWFPAGFGP